jgi:hypothetical protein
MFPWREESGRAYIKKSALAMFLTPCIERELEIEAASELLRQDDVQSLNQRGAHVKCHRSRVNVYPGWCCAGS